jgi:hypothetical protein
MRMQFSMSPLPLKLAWWPRPIILALRRLRQKANVSEVSLGYIARPCLKKKKIYIYIYIYTYIYNLSQNPKEAKSSFYNPISHFSATEP